MISRALRIGRIFGIEIKLDYSWFIAFTLVAWSLVPHYVLWLEDGQFKDTVKMARDPVCSM